MSSFPGLSKRTRIPISIFSEPVIIQGGQYIQGYPDALSVPGNTTWIETSGSLVVLGLPQPSSMLEACVAYRVILTAQSLQAVSSQTCLQMSVGPIDSTRACNVKSEVCMRQLSLSEKEADTAQFDCQCFQSGCDLYLYIDNSCTTGSTRLYTLERSCVKG